MGQQTKNDLKGSTKIKHRLADAQTIPSPSGHFLKELEVLNAEIKEWKGKIESSKRTQMAAKIGRRPKFSPAVSGENIKAYISDHTGHEHLDILKKNPEVYASRIASVASTIRKGSGINDQGARKIFLQAAAGNYNTDVKIDKKQRVENISSVNLQVVLRVQSLYFDAYINEGKKVITELKNKISGSKDDVFSQQRTQINQLVSKITCNLNIILGYKQFVNINTPSEKEAKVSFKQDIILNLYDFKEDVDEKRSKIILQSAYNLVRITRGCTLLYPIGYKIAEKVIEFGKYKGEEQPLGYLLKGQLLGGEYLLYFKEFEKCHQNNKEAMARKVIDSFKKLSAQYSLACSKMNNKTEANIQTVIAFDFSEYLINFYEVYNNLLMTALQMKPLSKEWINPFLTKTKNALMSIDSNERVESLYLKLENIGAEVGIPQY